MNYTIAAESFDSLESSWEDLKQRLKWDIPFMLPGWLRVWWQAFGAASELYLRSVREGKKVIGIAPLRIKDGKACFIGNADVCDYMDFVVVPGKEKAFFTALLDHLQHEGIRELYLESLRPDSTVLTSLVGLAKSKGCEVACTQQDVSLDLDLPSTWEKYLNTLTPKQRRETGRRFRRLEEMGDTTFRTIEHAEPDALNVFFKLLRQSRPDKAAFMTAQMESFFRALADAMAEAGMLRLGILEVSALPVAAVLCFDYNETVYLYNSGYDPQHGFLSVGLLSKVLSIKDSIARGKKRYDFLKGAEEYKYRLKGREIPIYNCKMQIAK
jgi:CelD/BcsL family acetyltransferase involved in cellulose biosynthesis